MLPLIRAPQRAFRAAFPDGENPGSCRQPNIELRDHQLSQTRPWFSGDHPLRSGGRCYAKSHPARTLRCGRSLSLRPPRTRNLVDNEGTEVTDPGAICVARYPFGRVQSGQTTRIRD